MTIGGLGTYGSIYDVRVNQSTKAKNTASSDFSKTMDSAAEMSTARSRESVHESVVTRHTEYTNPETNEKVPVDIRYTTSYSKDGIVCGKRSDVGGKLSARELWSLSFESPGDYKKVQDFLKSFSNDERLTFATQESFWNDFLQDDFDIEGFRAFYDSTDNGRIDIEKAMSEGRTMRETLTAQNAEYLNNNYFIRKVYSEEDLQPSWYKNGQIQLSEVYDPSVPSSTRITSTRGIERTNLVTNVKDMTLEEYKNYIHETISSFPVCSDKMGDYFSINISDDGFKAMQNDPEYEKWVLDDLKSAFATPMPGWARAIGGTKYQVVHYGATKEECHSTSWWTGYQNGSGGKVWEAQSKGSFWTKRGEQKKVQEKIDKKVAEKKELEEKWLQEAAEKRQAYIDFLNGDKVFKTNSISELNDFFQMPSDPKVAGILSAYEAGTFAGGGLI